MNKNKIVEMFEKGYSIDYIIEQYYKELNRDLAPVSKKDNSYIVPKPHYTKKQCTKFVYKDLYDYSK